MNNCLSTIKHNEELHISEIEDVWKHIPSGVMPYYHEISPYMPTDCNYASTGFEMSPYVSLKEKFVVVRHRIHNLRQDIIGHATMLHKRRRSYKIFKQCQKQEFHCYPTYRY